MPIRAAIFELDIPSRGAEPLADVFSQLKQYEEAEAGSARIVARVKRPAEGKSGLSVAVVTRRPERDAKSRLRGLGIPDALISSSDGFPLNLDSTRLAALATMLNLPPSECVYIGDKVGDFEAAAGAGMRSIGISWNGADRGAWRAWWPDFAVERPNLLFAILYGTEGLKPLGETLADGNPLVEHSGSIVRLGSSSYALGRYFRTDDRRYREHALSHLILDSKHLASAQEQLAGQFATAAEFPEFSKRKNTSMTIASVPPKPEDEVDRFDQARSQIADRLGAGESKLSGSIERFRCESDVVGKRVLLIDDVISRGIQTNACRGALLRAGAESVTILGAAVTQQGLTPDPCPLCGGDEEGGVIVALPNRETRERFLGCSRYPTSGCRWTQSIVS